MSKKIIHFQIPLLNNDMGIRDDFAISPETIGLFGKIMQKNLGDDYVLMFSPFKISAEESVDGITIKDFTEMDLKSFIEKFTNKENNIWEKHLFCLTLITWIALA